MSRLSALSIIAALLVHAVSCRPATASNAQHMVVTHGEPRPATDTFPGNFAGNVMVTPIFAATEPLVTGGASVAFEPAARSAWHTHPAGQTLFVTSGIGWVQEWGGPKIEVKPGDVIWTPPGVKHWHGATATTSMTHVAVQGVVGGKNVEWAEPVSDAQYAQ
jgi:quercetin dioxygenase-like cupin family protein